MNKNIINYNYCVESQSLHSLNYPVMGSRWIVSAMFDWLCNSSTDSEEGAPELDCSDF